MKMPLWAKTGNGKIEPFPFHLLETLSDGTIGLSFPNHIDRHPRNTVFGKFRNYFEWNPIDLSCRTGCEYRLKRQ